VYVTDICHFDGIELDASAPREGQRFAEYLRRIVRAGSASPEAGSRRTALPCRRRPGHRPCPGRLMVERQDVPPRIWWSCPACGEEGVIDNWRGSPYDLSIGDRHGDKKRRISAVIPEEAYRLLLSGMLFDQESERIIYSARLHPDGVALYAGEESLEELAGAVAFEANHAEARPRQRAWDGVFEMLDAARAR
jgi:hypothetical protein